MATAPPKLLSTTITSTKHPRSPSPAPTQKRQKTTTPPVSYLPSDFFDPSTSAPPTMTSASLTAEESDLDAEWAAFQAELNPGSQPPRPLAVTISAAPVLHNDPNAGQKGGGGEKETETEGDKEAVGEKEEAQERLLEEFEEMQGLEARVRRLKERREELRRRRMSAATLEVRGESGGGGVGEVVANGRGGEDVEVERGGGDSHSDEDGDEEDEEDEDFFLRGR